MRVLSWNVRSLRDGARSVAAVLSEVAADVVVVQEAPRLLGWRTSRALLARRAGMRPAGWSWAAGNLVLVAPHVHVTSARAVLMPKYRGLHRRAVALAEVRVDGVAFTLAGTHLDLQEEARLDSARRVRALVGDGPLVLGADVNDRPGSPSWEALTSGLSGGSPGPTYPAVGAHKAIDALVSSFPVTRLEVLDTGTASDHLGVLAEVRVS
ncbi:MAG: hypothetical protein JWM64_1140 [Frankiales bacterium]|nr:hypothetical protein [Frankiales bacterium]